MNRLSFAHVKGFEREAGMQCTLSNPYTFLASMEKKKRKKNSRSVYMVDHGVNFRTVHYSDSRGNVIEKMCIIL